MKKGMMFLVMAVVMLCSTGNVFADVEIGIGIEADNMNEIVVTSDNQLNNQVGVQVDGSSSASTSSATGGQVGDVVQKVRTGDVKVPVQGVQPVMPSHLYAVPDAKDAFRWNETSMIDLTGQFRRIDLQQVLKQTGEWFAEWGWGFVVKSYKQGYEKTDNVLVIDTFSLIPSEKTYIRLRPVYVYAPGNKKFVQLETAFYGYLCAIDNGADLIVIEKGMNTMAVGETSGIAATTVASAGNNASTGNVGYSQATTKNGFEPAVILHCYREVHKK